MFRLLGLEIQIECDQWPVAWVVGSQRLLHDRTYALEEVLLDRRLRTSRSLVVRQDRTRTASGTVFVPGEILLDRQRCAGSEGPLDAIAPLFVFWITIVRIQQDAAAQRMQEIAKLRFMIGLNKVESHAQGTRQAFLVIFRS